MSRLIYAEYLLDLIKDIDGERYGYIDAEDINNAPTVDAVPVKHGRWDVHEDTYGDDEAKCSVCGFEMAVNQPGNGLCMVSELNYCPCCGAKMDEVTE